MSSSVETLVNKEYKYGFVTDIESDTLPKGLSEDVVRLISAKKSEPEWLLEWRLKAYRRWLTMTEPHWPNVTYAPIDYQAHQLLLGAAGPRSRSAAWTRSIPKLLETYDEARHPAHRAEAARRRRGGRDLRLGLGRHDATRPSWPSTASSSARSARRCGSIPSWCGSTSARWCRRATTSSPRSTPRCSATARSCTCRRACAARWSCPPTSASTPRSTGQFERTLIIADEGAYVSYLEGCTAPKRDENQLHAAVVELVALDGRDDQVLDGAELVRRRRGRAGRHLQLRHQARQVRRRELEDLAGRRSRPARRSPGSIPSVILQGDNSVGEFYSVAVVNSQQQADTGTKMIHIGRNTRSTIVSKGISAGQGQQQLPRPGEGAAEGRRARATTPSATRC